MIINNPKECFNINRKLLLTAVAVALGAVSFGQSTWSQPSIGVKAGMLTCNVENGWGIVFGSTRDVKCTFAANNGAVERYVRHIDKFGVDLGYTAGGVIIWAVNAPTTNLGAGALQGTYAGVTAGASVVVGASANVPVGGSMHTVSLHPVSIEGMTGLNVPAGVAQIVLHTATE